MTASAYDQAQPNSFGTDRASSAGNSSSSNFFEGIVDAFRSWTPGTWTPFTIGVTTVAFIVAWPIGLGLLAYNLWGQNMRHSCRQRNHWKSSRRHRRYRGSGNVAFDEYREETLRRLEEEQAAFAEYVEKLRRAKDQSEFDSFMAERRAASQDNSPDPAA